MRTKVFITAFIGLSVAIIAALVYSPASVSAQRDKLRRAERPIPNRYIVVLHDTDEFGGETRAADKAADHARGFAMRVEKIYESALKGYSAEMSETEALRLSKHPSIQQVEEDSEVELQGVQNGATWGISRIDQRDYSYPLNTTYDYPNGGAGVHVYVLDTGVVTSHPEFGGRASEDYNATGDNTDVTNCNGHGTHVAGIIGSGTFGVAKEASIHSIRVYPCWSSGTMSNILAGIDWVKRHAIHPAVANMSFAGAASSTLDNAVQNLINSGVTVAVAAGNYADDSCRYSPSRVSDAITVGSMTQSDSRDPSTNYGRCIDLFAPGVLITSTWNEPGMLVNTISGTSMAAPHAAGVAALYLSANPTASPAQVSGAIMDVATIDRVYNVGQGSPNRLLFSGVATSEPAPPSVPPPTEKCDGLIFSGKLSNVGETKFESGVNGFAAASGIHSGKLSLPTGTTFALSLEQKKGRTWNTVATSHITSDSGPVLYKGKSGNYRWRLSSVIGTGDYSLCSVTP